MNTYKKIHQQLENCSTKERAIISQKFFKTGKGEYGEGDCFLGVSVPVQRMIAKKFHKDCDAKTVEKLLDSIFHEERLTGIFILVIKYNEASKTNTERQWLDLYLNKLHRVNNWDLVDSSAHLILGRSLLDKERTLLYEYAKSDNIWENRVAIIATLYFIRKNDVKDILALSKIMLSHKHDLIHKAAGWMLREAWQKKPAAIEDFLDDHTTSMPRTMLRYTIEKMPEKLRKHYLTKCD